MLCLHDAFVVLALLLPAMAFGQSPAPVNLGTAGNYVGLAKTGISTTGTTQITGDLGVSPAAATYITGFGLVMDPSGTFSTSSLVTGRVYAANYAVPTPAQLTTAVSDMETAYTDAAGRTLPTYTNLHAGNLTGQTLTPGLYKWTTGVLVSAGGVTISGSPTDVWIFQIAQNATFASGAQVTLIGGAHPSRIFWQVAGQVTLGTTATMKGVILCQTAIILNTGATLTGRALAQTAITLDGNVITAGPPADTTRPTVVSTSPVNLATGVQLNKLITATFSEAMDAATINTNTFTLKIGAVPVTGTVSYIGTTATFTPGGLLLPNTVYTGTITNGVKDVAGNYMLNNYVWTFTTGAAPDTIPPTVTFTSPANLETGVALNKKIAATFSEAMNPATITNANFMLKQGATPVPGTVTYAGLTATFTPSGILSPFTVYQATITTGVKDLAGNNMAANYVWTFTTGAAPDTIPPTVTFTSPANLETGVALNKKIAATFSEAMDPLTITNIHFTLMQGTTPIPGTVTYAGLTATFTPSGILSQFTMYQATITTGVEDLAGNAMAANYVWTFTTGAAPDTIPPTVTYTSPANLETGVALNKKIAATFSEAMDPATITNIHFLLMQGTTPIPGTVTYAGLTTTFSPSGILSPFTVYQAIITTGVEDLAGNAMAADYVWTFTTGAAPDTIPPTVTFTSPANLETGVALNKKIAATFSEAMDPSTITNVHFMLMQGTSRIPGTVTYAGLTATFSPSGALSPSTMYRATVTTGVEDLAGNAMLANYVWTFTTGAAPETIPPTVTFTSPANLEIGVALNKKFAATFSEAMDPATITNLHFLLKQGTTPVPGTVTYAGLTASFSPSGALSPSSVYRVIVTTGVEDLAGNAMASDYSWTFNTGAAADTIPPNVTFTSPANLETGVALNKKIAATFSEAMDPSTVTNVQFTLMQGATPIPGTVTYAGLTASFSPSGALSPSTMYKATVTTGVKDLAGNTMVSDYSWIFNTGAGGDTTPPTVTFTNPVNLETDVALNKKIAATFSEAMDPATITNIHFLLKEGTTPIPGTVTYAGLTATFTPSGLLSSSTVYRATVTTGVKDLAGNAMVSDYSWTFTTGSAPDNTPPTVTFTSPANLETGVELNKLIAAAFSEVMDPVTIHSASFTLMRGTTPVAGYVSYANLVATFSPTLELTINTVYTATISVNVTDLAGNAMVSEYTWTFTAGVVGDITPPTIVSTDPANLETGVALNKIITATFSEEMDPITMNSSTFTLMRGTTPVAGSVSYANLVATFSPTFDLILNSVYTATITTGVKDLAGNAMVANYVWTFNTAACGDSSSPTVTLTSPVNLETGVALNKKIVASFCEAMNPITINSSTFTLMRGATPVAGSVSYTNQVATFSPSLDLNINTMYTATISTGVEDLAGHAMASGYTWTFTTGGGGDTAPPTVISTNPANLETRVLLSKIMTAVFSEAMDPITINSSTFTLTRGTTPVAGSVTYANQVATFSPTNELNINTMYTATISTGVKDLSGNAMTAAYSWDFTTVVTTGIETLPNSADGFTLSQNYPNPFNSTTLIHYSLATSERVTLKVYDVLGHEVATLVSAHQDAGSYTVRFNALESGIGHVPGVYFYRLVAGTYRAMHTLILYR